MTLQEILSNNTFVLLIAPNEQLSDISTELGGLLFGLRNFRAFEHPGSQYTVIGVTDANPAESIMFKQISALMKGRSDPNIFIYRPAFELINGVWAPAKVERVVEVLTPANPAPTPILSLAELVKSQSPVLVIIPNTLVCIDIANWFDTVVCDYLPIGNLMFNFVLGRKTDELNPVNLTENLRKDIKEHGLALRHLKTFPVYLTPADKWEPKRLEGEELETFYHGHFSVGFMHRLEKPEENPILDDVLNGMPVQVIMPIGVHSDFINWLHKHTKGLRKIHDLSRFYGDMTNRHAVVLLADGNNVKTMLAIAVYDTAILSGGVRSLQIPEAFYLPALIWSELKRLSADELTDFFYNDLGVNIMTGEFVYPAPVTNDNVNHPAHYTAGKIETIDFIEGKGFNYRIGNVIKYVSRHDKKYSDPEKQLEDLKKAAWYLEREIKAREDALLSRGNG